MINIKKQNLKNFSWTFKKTLTFQKVSRSPSEEESGLLTGYYEPEIRAFNYPKKGSYPIYKHPKTISNKFDYKVSRKIINKGYLSNNNLEIAWVENEIEAFFLHIQGSGRLVLDNNKVIKVRYAGSNKKSILLWVEF